MPIMKILFICSGMGARMKSSVKTSESDDKCAKCQGSYNEDEVVTLSSMSSMAPCRLLFMSNLSHSVLLDYINRLYYLLITCYIYG